MENFYDDILEHKRSQILKEQEERDKMIRDAKNSSTQFYYDTTGNIDFGIPSGDYVKPQHIDISASSYVAPPEEKVEYGIPLSVSNQENYRPNMRNSDSQVDFGIPTAEVSKMYNPDNYRPNLRNSDSQIDFGIPTDETARMYNPDNYKPNLRNSDSQMDFGIPTQDIADMEKISIEKWKNERNAKFENQRKTIIETTPTKYEEKVDIKENDFNHLVNGDADWALSKLNSLLHMPDTLEYTQYVAGYLEILKEKPEYYNRILSTILYDFVSIKKKIIKGEHLQKYERQQLFNSIKFFAIIVEKGYPIDYDLFNEIENPYQHNYGNYFHTERVPYDIVIQQMIEVIEQKSDIIGNEVTNPVNVVSSTKGEQQMKATELGKLALKAHYTNHKLSDDVMNFPNNMVMSIGSTQEFQEARERQMQQDQVVREQQLAGLTQEMVETKEGHSLK